jgi:hypothetical protein
MPNRREPTYNKKAELFADEADAYVQRYAARRGRDESLKAFRFRVWKVALYAGKDAARSFGQLSPS